MKKPIINWIDKTTWYNSNIDKDYWVNKTKWSKVSGYMRKYSDIPDDKIIGTSFDASDKSFSVEFSLNKPDFISLKGYTREGYVIEMVKKHFPEVEFRDYKQIMEMGSIVSELGDFLIELHSYYSIMVDLPEYADVRGLNEKEWKELKEYRTIKTEKLREIQKLNSKDRAECNARCNQRLANVSKELESYKHNGLIRIFDLRRSDLPLDVNQQISNYKPEHYKLDIKTKKGSRVLSRQNLTDYFILQYRKHLLEIYSENKDIGAYIDANKAKSFRGGTFVGRQDSLFRILKSTDQIVSINPDGTHRLIQELNSNQIKEMERYLGPDSIQDGTGSG